MPANPADRADAAERADDVRQHDGREPPVRVGVDREQREPQDELLEAEVCDRSEHRHQSAALKQHSLVSFTASASVVIARSILACLACSRAA
jgi:hypothetical protein